MCVSVHVYCLGRGHGTKLMRECAKVSNVCVVFCCLHVYIYSVSYQVALENGCSRMNWQMLAANSRTAALYDRVGGSCLREWKNFFLMKDTMQLFAQGTPHLKEGVTIRKATKKDVPAIVSMIKVQWFIYRTSENLRQFAMIVVVWWP